MRIRSRALLTALLITLVVMLAVTFVGQVWLNVASAPGGASSPSLSPLLGASDVTPPLSAPATAPAIDGTATPDLPRKLLAASTLSEFTVTNEQGMLLGRVENVLVDFPTGRVQYAFLMFGRDPATANLFFAVPFAALDLNRQGQGFVLRGDLTDYQRQIPLSRQVLDLSPALPQDFHRDFGQTVDAFGQPLTPLPGVTPIPTVGPAKGSLVLIPQLIGWQLEDGLGRPLGIVRDFPIDPAQRLVRWAVVAPGDLPSPNTKLVPVPLSGLRFDTGDRTLRLIDGGGLQGAPGFKQDDWPDMSSAGWDTAFARYWQRRGILTHH